MKTMYSVFRRGKSIIVGEHQYPNTWHHNATTGKIDTKPTVSIYGGDFGDIIYVIGAISGDKSAQRELDKRKKEAEKKAEDNFYSGPHLADTIKEAVEIYNKDCKAKKKKKINAEEVELAFAAMKLSV